MINQTTDVSGSLAASAQSLDKLRAQARQSPDQALKAAAQQFETVFMNMMLKSMRDATPQDGMFDSEQTKMFTGMLDQQLAQNMSSRGVGLADMMVRQLSGSFSPDAVQMPQGAQANHGSVMPPAYSENMAILGKNSPSPQTPLQQDFVQQLTPYAIQANRETGVPVQLMLGQAALESGWGRREILMADGGNSYNLFGIKASGNWNGKVAEVMTTEYHNGVPSKQVERFRAYDSYAEAFSDYANMLRSNPRYASVVQEGQGSAEAAYALQRAGYATDPNYADKLVKVMSRINALT